MTIFSMALSCWTPSRIAAIFGAWFGVCLTVLPAWGGGRYCVVDGWGTGEGLLPQSSIISMAQTRDGYLWLGTRNGMARFDGVHFTVFDESTTPNLSSIQTVKLFEDSRSNLWIGTETAGAMLVTNGQILKLLLGEGRHEGHLVSICEDSVGAVWMLTEDAELGRYWQGNVDVWNFGVDNLTIGRSVIAEKSGTVWVGTDHSLVGIDAAKVQGRTLPEKARASVGELDLLLASRNGGYWRLADGVITKWSGTDPERNLGPYPWNAGPDQVRAACEDWDGNLIVGTGQGVFWFDGESHAIRICTTNGLANDSVLSMVADREGNLWVGMDGGGPTQHPLNRVTRSIFSLLDSSAGLDVQSICEDSKGGLWFSPKDHDHDFCYLKDGVTRNVGSVFGSLKFNPKAVLVDDQDRVWAATMGVNLLLLQGSEFAPAPGVGLLNRWVSALYQGHDGRLWVGTQGGLGCWDGASWRIFTTNNGLSGNIVRAIADDTNGDVWIGTEHGGVDLLHNGQVTCFQRTNGCPSDNISCLCLDSNGVLWVGTIGNGLARLAHGQWKHYTTQNGLSGNSIDYIIDDGAGFLWVGSNAGLMRLSKKELGDFDPDRPGFLSCRSYDQKDGLPATECTYGSQPAACRTRVGLLWFPTIAGMVSVNPSEIQPNTNPPPVVIESVYIDQQPQNTNGLRAPSLKSVTVPAGRENLEIHFTSLDLAAADRAIFQYRLEGYQTTNWTLAGKDRLVRYLNLPHGHYQFQVRARNEDGFWNTEGASLNVIVLPPFWETWWFRAGVGAALLGIIIGAVHFISTQKLQQQLADMRQQQALEKERARIARDIHDQVGASLTQLSLLGEMVQADKDHPNEAEDHARQISQTARETARELDEIVWTVNPSNDTLDGLVNYICKNAQEYLAVAGLRYRVDMPADLPPAAISPEARHNVFLAAKEAVTNVVRHARASEAWLRLRLESQRFTLEIEDNGRGPGGKDEKAAASRNGLRNMRRRMEDVGGEFFIGQGSRGGTLVRLTVPLRKR
jgi:signal transduction histidine kinase/ligand-binding sensor domain-containing protein